MQTKPLTKQLAAMAVGAVMIGGSIVGVALAQPDTDPVIVNPPSPVVATTAVDEPEALDMSAAPADDPIVAPSYEEPENHEDHGEYEHDEYEHEDDEDHEEEDHDDEDDDYEDGDDD